MQIKASLACVYLVNDLPLNSTNVLSIILILNDHLKRTEYRNGWLRETLNVKAFLVDHS